MHAGFFVTTGAVAWAASCFSRGHFTCHDMPSIRAEPLTALHLRVCVVGCSYLYVEDVAEAFDCVLHKGTTGEVYNIGTEKERTVLEVRGLLVFFPDA